jgi:hypothetical protein
MTTEANGIPAKNLGGRPKGSTGTRKSKSERLFDRLLNSRGNKLERIIDKVLDLAEDGDTAMLKAVLDRAFPARGRAIKLNLSGDVASAADRVLAAMDRGDITPAEAKDALDVLRARAEIVEAAEFAKRLDVLERASNE